MGDTLEAKLTDCLRLVIDEDEWNVDPVVQDVLDMIAPVQAENARLREALENIANGDGVYGMQAGEYKQIARTALKGGEDDD